MADRLLVLFGCGVLALGAIACPDRSRADAGLSSSDLAHAFMGAKFGMTADQVSAAVKTPLATCDEVRARFLEKGMEVPIDISFSCGTEEVVGLDKEWERRTEPRFAEGLVLFDENIFVTFEFLDLKLYGVQVDFDFSAYRDPAKRQVEVTSRLKERFEKTMGKSTLEASSTIDGGYALRYRDARRASTVWSNPSDKILNFTIWDQPVLDARKREQAERDEGAIR